MPKNIVVYMDGTRNDPDDEHTTNIHKMYTATAQDEGQHTLYISGVGNERDGSWIEQVLGGAFGMGADAKIDEAVDWVNDQYKDGDSVFVFGFSRGAAEARVVTSKLPHVTFLGCYDTVGAFGLPLGFGQDINLFKDMHVGDHVKRALHLVALDETRPAFVPTLMNERDGIDEIWLSGAHSDVGGGVPHTGLSDYSLGIMAEYAKKHGLWLIDGFLDALQPDGLGKIHYNTDSKLGADPRAAYVQRNDKPTKTSPRIHPSAINRMSAGHWPRAWLPSN